MKKIVFLLVALLFAAPAWAVVDITVAQVGDTNEVIISVTSDEANLIRAYSLDIQLTPYLENDAPTVLEVTALNPGYWIFPGTIQINADGDITNPGSPVAEYGDLTSDTLGGLDSNGVTVELASLYVDEVNEPAQNGVLLSVKVNDDACITITANVSRAGASGVVMEDPDEVVTVNLPAELCIDVVHGVPECFDSSHADYAEWVTVGMPDSWCFMYQCYGDADGKQEGDPFGGYFYVAYNDLNALIGSWKKPTTDPAFDIAADFSRSEDGDPFGGYFRVEYKDLNILISNWKDDSGLAADCGGTLLP